MSDVSRAVAMALAASRATRARFLLGKGHLEKALVVLRSAVEVLEGLLAEEEVAA
jgi:hypothetical protein